MSTYRIIRNSKPSRIRPPAYFLMVFALFSALLCLVWAGSQPAYAVDVADTPMFTRVQPPPPNIMILLDDSGSMNFSVLVKGVFDGAYPNPDSSDDYNYVFDNLGDSVYTDDWRYMGEEGRMYWQSQWFEINAMYYNPNTTYLPWPDTDTTTFENADTERPRPHPVINTAQTLDLDGKSFKVGSLNIKHAHYFVMHAGTIYLVVIDGVARKIIYYTVAVTVADSPKAEKVSAVTEDPSPPAAIVTGRTYAEERQNFANWYTYYRRREYMAKAALAAVIKNIEGVRVGILGINGRIKVPLKPVKVVVDEKLQDESDTLVEALYRFPSDGSTPLKTGLVAAGEYYKNNTGNLGGVSGAVPYPEDGGACQQSFTIIMTDGYYADTSFTPVGNTDGGYLPPYGDWGGGQNPYTDDYGGTLADIAMYYYANDLSNFADQVPTSKLDKAAHQHMVAYALAFGVDGTLTPDDYELDPTSDNFLKHKTSGQYVVWPQVPGAKKPESIDDLWHASVNGRGEFLNAANPNELIEALQTLMESIGSRHEGSAASVSINGDELYAQVSDEIRVFQSSYSNLNDEWTGDVKAYQVNPFTGEVLVDDPEWSAAEKLQTKSAKERSIFSYDDVSGTGLDFTVSGLTDAQKAKFAPYPAAEMVAYLSGKEIEGYRRRSQKLADIVHSAPVFDNGILYVGGNDGMLHAFNAVPPTGSGDPELGEEIFAYVPNLVFDNLKLLADTAYTHKYYVDLTPVVKAGRGLLGGSETKTLLIGGLRNGGKGYFALDVTSPNAMTKFGVKWEFPNTSTSDADRAAMGYSFGRPVIAPSYHDIHKWIVIVANGYNSADGQSALLILDPQNGTVIKRIEAGAGPDNGLSTPIAVDVNLDGIVDFVYAGDLKGNLWKFDLSSDKIDEWKVAHEDSRGDRQPLFVARGPEADAAEALQPITAKPDVMLHPTRPGYMVCFGTGKFLGDSDFTDRTINTVYGIWDYGDPVYQVVDGWSRPDPEEYPGNFLTRDLGLTSHQLSNQDYHVKLLKQEAEDYSVDVDGNQRVVRVLSYNQPIWLTQSEGGGQLPNPSSSELNHAGWYFDLSTDMFPDGERVVSDVLLRDGKLIVIGFNPDDARCARGGDSIFMEVNAGTGGRINASIFDINDDGSIGGGSVEDPGDGIVIDTPGGAVWVPPSGLQIPGQLHTPIILALNPHPPGDDVDGDDDDDVGGAGGCVEAKIASASTGEVRTLLETCAKLGVVYWKQMQ